VKAGRHKPVTQRITAAALPEDKQIERQPDGADNGQHREGEVQHQDAGVAARPVLVFKKIHARSMAQNDTFGAMRACSVSILSSSAWSNRPNNPATKLLGNCSR